METMRDYSEFCEQLNDIRVRFHKWDSCERTVALYYLMVGLPFANAKFLQHALEQCVRAAYTPEAQIMEHNANDPAFVSALLSERRQVALSTILAHLPLLRPGNKETADRYLSIIRTVLTEFITPPYKIYNECVEIMSYVFIHPAFNKDDKKSFRQLLRHVLNRVSPENFIHSPVAESSDESISPNPESINRRSSIPGPDVWSSQESLLQLHSAKPRSYSLSNDNKTVPPIAFAQLQSSSSETRLQELQLSNDSDDDMRSIVFWLKSLRLHKYSWVFNGLSYERMLELSEETLQSIGITKGARHKLLLSIGKLKERQSVLCELGNEVMNGGDLLNALKRLKGVLQTPLRVTLGEDLPSLIVKVFGKVCTQLLMRRQSSEECFHLFTSLSERVENSDVFTDEQKRRMSMWREQISKIGHTHTYNNRHMNNYRIHHSSMHHGNILTPSVQSATTQGQKSSSYPNMQKPIGGHRHSVGNINVNNFVQYLPASGASTNGSESSRSRCGAPSNSDHRVRFQEAENDASKTRKQLLKNVEIESSLESLCLQMMEHALGP